MLRDLSEEVLASLRPVADALGAQLVLEGLDGPLVVPGDADQLTQVFANQVESGLKCGAAEQALRISADCGAGIAAVHLPRLTGPFDRADSHRSREKGGTGLGLAMVKHIVVRHRGWLKIDSRLGEGSVFSVILPEGKGQSRARRSDNRR